MTMAFLGGGSGVGVRMGVMGVGAVVLLCKRIKIGDHGKSLARRLNYPFGLERHGCSEACGFQIRPGVRELTGSELRSPRGLKKCGNGTTIQLRDLVSKLQEIQIPIPLRPFS